MILKKWAAKNIQEQNETNENQMDWLAAMLVALLVSLFLHCSLHCSLHCLLSPSFSAASLRGEARFVADCRVEREGLPPQPRELAEALWRRSEAFVTNVPFSLAYIDTLARLFGLGISRGLA